ncbi:MAG: RsiV family protein [Thomasclavelia sp.]|uniref:RsiV family protein n=1 Tax=Thomasclavelia sp. TaxID=3025757 RepID=UPI0039A18D48
MKKHFLVLLLIIAPLFINSVNACENNAKLVLLKEKQYETDGTIVTIKFPKVINVNDKVKKDINKLILKTIDTYLDEIKEFDKNPNTEHKLIVDINFENYYSDNEIFSFSINSSQILADSYLQKKFYTINLDTGDIYNVEHFLGTDYQNIILSTVKKQIAENTQKNPNLIYFDEEVNNLKISIDQPFYINKDNQVVVVFNQFQIAPGYMSLPEFIIK